jgi:outer membrane protein assembly factor BamB
MVKGLMPRRMGWALGVAAAVVGLAGCWPVPGQSADRDAYNELERGFDAGSVAGFTERWTATVDDVSPRGVGHPVVSVGGGVRVHVTSGRTVYTFNAGTGSLLWSSVPEASTLTIEEVDTDAFVYQDFLTTSVRTSGTRWEAAQCLLTTGGCDTLGGEVPGRVEAVRVTGSNPGQLILLLSEFGPSSQSAYAYIGGSGSVLLTDQPGASRLTVSATHLFHAGVGVGTAPANGARAFPIRGGAGWSTVIDGTEATSPVLGPDGAMVFVGTDAGTVHALATTDGTVLWSTAVGAAVTAPPALAEGRLHVPTAAGLVTLSSTGEHLWSSSDADAVTVQPAVASGVVFTGTPDGIQAYDTTGCAAPTCGAVWTATTGSEITGAPTVSAGRLYVGTRDGRLIAYGPPAN